MIRVEVGINGWIVKDKKVQYTIVSLEYVNEEESIYVRVEERIPREIRTLEDLNEKEWIKLFDKLESKLKECEIPLSKEVIEW